MRPEHMERLFSKKETQDYSRQGGFDKPYVGVKGRRNSFKLQRMKDLKSKNLVKN
jgi:hypothetical protein